MKTLLVILLLAVTLVRAADVKISDLPETNAPSSSAVLPLVDNGHTWKVTKDNLLSTAIVTATNSAKSYTDAKPTGSTNWTDAANGGATLAGAGKADTLLATNGVTIGDNAAATNTYQILRMLNSITDGGGSYSNSILQIGVGLNNNPPGSASYLQWESGFRNHTNDPLAKEFHYDFGLTNGNVNRPFSGSFYRETGASAWALGGALNVYDSLLSTQQIAKTETGGLNFLAGARLVSFYVNNAPVLAQWNVSSNAFLSLPYFNNYNHLIVPATFNPQGTLNLTNASLNFLSGYGCAWNGNTYVSVNGTTMTIDAPTYLYMNKQPYTVSGSPSIYYRPAGVIWQTYVAAANSGSTNTDLQSITLPATTLGVNKESLHIVVGGICATNTNSKQITLNFGATTLFDSGANTNSGGWLIEAYVSRTGATTQSSIATWNGPWSVAPLWTTPGETLSGTIVLKTTATGAASSDISQKYFLVEFKPMTTNF